MTQNDREEMIRWLEAHCPLKIEYDFWYQFYDDLDDCFDDLEPWRIDEQLMHGQWNWRGFDAKFTGRRIVDAK